MIEAMTVLDNLVPLSIKCMQENGCKDIDEATVALENLNDVEKIYRKVSDIEEKQPTGERSAITTIKETCIFLLQTACYIPLRIKIAVFDGVIEFFKDGKKLPKELEPKIKEMKHYLKMIQTIIKKIDALMTDLTEEVSSHSVSQFAQSTSSFNFFL